MMRNGVASIGPYSWVKRAMALDSLRWSGADGRQYCYNYRRIVEASNFRVRGEMVSHQTFNLTVPSSSLGGPTNFRFQYETK